MKTDILLTIVFFLFIILSTIGVFFYYKKRQQSTKSKSFVYAVLVTNVLLFTIGIVHGFNLCRQIISTPIKVTQPNKKVINTTIKPDPKATSSSSSTSSSIQPAKNKQTVNLTIFNAKGDVKTKVNNVIILQQTDTLIVYYDMTNNNTETVALEKDDNIVQSA